MNEFEEDRQKTIDHWIDSCFRAMREKFRTVVTCWTHNQTDLMIEQAKDLQKQLNSFVGYLERKQKFE